MSLPGPGSKLPRLGRRGLAKSPASAAGGGGGACLFLKSGSACRRLESKRRPEAAARGEEGIADAGARAGAGNGAAGSAAEACTRRGAARPGVAAEPPPAACKRWRLGARDAALQARPGAGARGAARQLLRPGQLCAWVCVGVDMRGLLGSPPLVTPPPTAAAACAAPTRRRVCAATQLARGPGPPGRGPGRKTLPIREAGGGGRLRNTAAPPPPKRNVVSAGTGLRDRSQAGRRGEELARRRNLVREASSPSPSSVHGKWTWELPARGVWEQRCRGGRKRVEPSFRVF